MEIYVAKQALEFLLAWPLGAIIGISYDLVFTFYKVLSLKRTAVFFIDIIQFAIYSFMCYLYIFTVSTGEIRFFIVLGVLLGYIIYKLSLSKYIKSFFSIILFFILKAVKRIFKVILTPVKLIFTVFHTKFCKKIKKQLKFTVKIVKKHLKNTKEMLYN